jgi:hypothetical protein
MLTKAHFVDKLMTAGNSNVSFFVAMARGHTTALQGFTAAICATQEAFPHQA